MVKSTLQLKDNSDDYSYKISANYLSNFMPERKFLELTLKNMAFIPRYYYEYLDYMTIKFSNERIDGIFIPMVCFCDIPLHQLHIHVEGPSGYGKFGIALTKGWGERNGLQPIHYINPQSNFAKQFQNSLNMALDSIANNINNTKEFDEISDTLLDQLKFMKPNTGKMNKKKGDKEYQVNKNFHDEHEWRFVPDLSIKKAPELIIDPIDQEYYLAEKSTKIFTNSMPKIRESYLKFSVDDIKYIFVETEKDREELINFIQGMKGHKISKDKKVQMISKIVIYDDLVEDL